MIKNTLENLSYYNSLFSISVIIITIVIWINFCIIMNMRKSDLNKSEKRTSISILAIGFIIVSMCLYTSFISNIKYNLAKTKLLQKNVFVCQLNENIFDSKLCKNDNIKKEL